MAMSGHVSGGATVPYCATRTPDISCYGNNLVSYFIDAGSILATFQLVFFYSFPGVVIFPFPV